MGSLNKTRQPGCPEELAIMVLDDSFLITLSENGSLITSKGGTQEETYLTCTFPHLNITDLHCLFGDVLHPLQTPLASVSGPLSSTRHPLRLLSGVTDCHSIQVESSGEHQSLFQARSLQVEAVNYGPEVLCLHYYHHTIRFSAVAFCSIDLCQDIDGQLCSSSVKYVRLLYFAYLLTH